MNSFDSLMTEPVEGNTEVDSSTGSSSKKMLGRLYKYWCGTHHLHYDTLDTDFLTFLTKQKKYIYGTERCPTTGKVHYQFFFESSIKSGVRLSALHRAHPVTHFENCKADLEANYAYCAKGGNVTTNIIDVYIPKLTPESMYHWQRHCLSIALSMPNDRKIIWFWDEKGCTGKTTMGKYLSHFHKAIPLRGKTNDILHCAAENVSLIYLFIAPRTNEDYFPYEGLELVKDGFYMSGKYESKPVIRPVPHVFVFSNFEPNMSKCSADRWEVIECTY